MNQLLLKTIRLSVTRHLFGKGQPCEDMRMRWQQSLFSSDWFTIPRSIITVQLKCWHLVIFHIITAYNSRARLHSYVVLPCHVCVCNNLLSSDYLPLQQFRYILQLPLMEDVLIFCPCPDSNTVIWFPFQHNTCHLSVSSGGIMNESNKPVTSVINFISPTHWTATFYHKCRQHSSHCSEI